MRSAEIDVRLRRFRQRDFWDFAFYVITTLAIGAVSSVWWLGILIAGAMQ
jgi:hypothetical protein